jgi:hypothetical protein
MIKIRGMEIAFQESRLNAFYAMARPSTAPSILAGFFGCSESGRETPQACGLSVNDNVLYHSLYRERKKAGERVNHCPFLSQEAFNLCDYTICFSGAV